MCGVFGVIVGPDASPALKALQEVVHLQFRLSETRGSDASGWAVRTADKLTVYREPIRASRLIRMPQFQELFTNAVRNGAAAQTAMVNGVSGHAAKIHVARGHANSRSWRPQSSGVNGSHLHAPLAVIGHSRMVTNGMQSLNCNNQPVICDGVVGVHNGIIVNDAALWRRFPDLQRSSDVDTEVLLRLVRKFQAEGKPLIAAVQEAYKLIDGAASVALLFEDALWLVLATNTGSLYYCRDPQQRSFLFASEQTILDQLLERRSARELVGDAKVTQIAAGSGLALNLESGDLTQFNLDGVAISKDVPCEVAVNGSRRASLAVYPEAVTIAPQDLRRCRRCVLPETFPFIRFDAEGVCNYCHCHKPVSFSGPEALAAAVEPYRSRDGRHDCLVAFSGGRDSCFALHYLKTVLHMNPVTFTYDWGLVTDLARRNQARLCGKLGVEHILISADIGRKRRNVRKNIEAWLRKPDLGMIPLFMAGDKQFFYHANRLSTQMNLPVIVFAVNPYEKTGFKTGFCGVNESRGGMYFDFSLRKKLDISWYYIRQYLRNPRYVNSSIPDTVWAYVSSFVLSHEYLMLFDYLPWREDEINGILRGEYDWELAPDTDSTWRIGDGTAAFYNYIYYTVAGFTENDTFRSNQVREGVLSRDEALRLVRKENQPRWESIRWYANTIGFNCDEALTVINSMPKLSVR